MPRPPRPYHRRDPLARGPVSFNLTNGAMARISLMSIDYGVGRNEIVEELVKHFLGDLETRLLYLDGRKLINNEGVIDGRKVSDKEGQ